MGLSGFDDSDSIISWAQFTHYSARPAGEDEDAHIHTYMKLDYQLGGSGSATTVSSVTMKIVMITEECWVVKSEMTDYLLKHEQGHYDIQALVAREFYEKVMGTKGANDDKVKKQIKALETKYQDLTKTTNKRYDVATNHGLNKQVQQTWNKKIEAAKQNPKGLVTDLP